MSLNQTLRDLHAAFPASDQKMPVLFVGHGNPMNAIEDNEYSRAWAEVGTPFGQLRFGRMPAHWGLGIYANDGSCWNCDHGDNQDRLVFTTNLFGNVIPYPAR